MRWLFTALVMLFVLHIAGAFVQPREVSSASTNISPDGDAAIVRFRLDPSRSTFMVHADRSGLLYFKGHSHRIAVRDFSGEAALSLDAINPASLTINIRADSLEETRDIFTAQQKAIIKKELETIVLETEKYPAITYKSTSVKGSLKNGAFHVIIAGNLTLHGVTRHVEIPAVVTVEGDVFRAKGEFSLNRKRFKVNATNAFNGLVRVKHKLKFVFDIVGERI